MKTSILLLFGGESSEHEVSIVSAANVHAELDKEKYDVKLCYISKEGVWRLVDSMELREGPTLLPVLGEQTFQANGENIDVDVLFPVLHGLHGEDGDVQGLARLLHLPCVGPGLIGAAVTMDKDITKRLLRDMKIPVVEWVMWHKSVPIPPYEDMVARLGEVLFIKPDNAGSSVGVSKVRNQEEYEKALEVASEHDVLVMIERAINAREIEVAVMGNGAQLIISTPGEIIPGEEFYSYDDKYSETSTSQVNIPADLPQDLVEQIKQHAGNAYLATRGQGMARVDFFLDEKNNIYLNEINSIPGFTNISMYPKMMMQMGMTYAELCDRLISLAREAGE